MADVFISYKKEDIRLADTIVEGLRADGFSVWWDDSLEPKDAWDATLEREIAAASAVVVLWTPRSVGSDWVRTEAHYGLDRGKFIPVMLEPCTIPLAFMLRQTIKLSDWKGDRTSREWRKLVTWIADLSSTKLGNANVPQALVAAQPNPFREIVGRLPSGDPIVDGALVNASTPAGTIFRDGESRPVMRIVPMGAFLIGSPTTDPDRTPVEGPQKRIEIPTPFAMGVFPVLVSEYNAIMGSPPPGASAQPNAGGDVPVTNVSFGDAQTFVAALSSSTQEAYRVPSEAEWEYACRSGTRSRYSFGDTIDSSQATFAPASGPSAAGRFPNNGFGLFDMHGNVREWTADLWHESFDSTPLDGSPALDGHGSMRVVRGGGWSDEPAMLRSSARMRATQTTRAKTIGFRVIRALS